MQTMRKRSVIKLIGLSALSLATLAACGKKEEPAAPAGSCAGCRRPCCRQAQGQLHVCEPDW